MDCVLKLTMDEFTDTFLVSLRYWNERYRGVPRTIYVNPSDYDKLLDGLCLGEGYWNGIEIVQQEDIMVNELVLV